MDFGDAAGSGGALGEGALSLHQVVGNGGGEQAQPTLAVGERPHPLDGQVIPLPHGREERLAFGEQRLGCSMLVGGCEVELVGVPHELARLVLGQRGRESL